MIDRYYIWVKCVNSDNWTKHYYCNSLTEAECVVSRYYYSWKIVCRGVVLMSSESVWQSEVLEETINWAMEGF